MNTSLGTLRSSEISTTNIISRSKLTNEVNLSSAKTDIFLLITQTLRMSWCYFYYSGSWYMDTQWSDSKYIYDN